MKDPGVNKVPVVTSVPVVLNGTKNDVVVKSYTTRTVKNKDTGNMVRNRRRECSDGKT